MFKNLPLFLLLMLLLLIGLDPFIPIFYKQLAYGLSLSLKSFVIALLPFLIFMLLFKTLSKLTQNGTKLILFILAGVCVSNFFSTMLSYEVGKVVFSFEQSLANPQDESSFAPLFLFEMPKLIQNDHAMFLAIFLGLLMPYISKNLSSRLREMSEWGVGVLLKLFGVLVPLFVLGFFIKLIHEGALLRIATDYFAIFLVIAISVFGYIALLYLISSSFKLSSFLSKIKNMAPALMTGFSTMSSAAAMPLTLIGTGKNSSNSELGALSVPVTVNTHLIGDCFAIPIFAFAVMKNFGFEEPAFFSYLIFSLYFVLAKFSVAAIPGGGIVVMLPILESELGFTSEMSSLITALYMLFDPVITGANVGGNGAFALILDKLYAFISLKERRLQQA